MKKSYDLDVLMSNLGKKKQKKTVKDYGQSNDYTGLKNLGIDDKVYKTVDKPMVQGWQKVHYQNSGQYSNERKQIPKLYRKK